MSGHLIGVTGIPGTGKSHFARSARAVGKTLVALADPKEQSFYGAENVTLFADLDWRPSLNQYKADALNRLFAWCVAAGKSDAAYVVIDTMSEVSDLTMHEVLKLHATADPGDVPHGRAYTAHDSQIKSLMTELRRMVIAGKTVICTFHAQLKELEGVGEAKKQKGMSGGDEWTFDEQMLPVLNTSMRQRIAAPFDLWLYTVPVGFGPGRKFYVTAQSDNVRPAKHSVTFKPGVNIARIGNTVSELLAVIQEPAPAQAPAA